ncbi:MAG: hypothetical protein GTO18_12390 [Anaerolineales bacterium]|nr:hypothetical protein [Anaerolineales bacterium]
MSISTEHSRTIEKFSSSSPRTNPQIQASLSKAIENFECENYRTAVYHFERTFGLVQSQGPEDLLFVISMCLGVSHAAIGEHEASLKCLDFAQSQQGLSAEGEWPEKLVRLIDLLQLLISTNNIEMKFSEILSKLREDAGIIHEELTMVSQQLRSSLLESLDLIPHASVSVMQEVKKFDLSVTPSIYVRLLGHFEAYCSDGTPLRLCPHRKSQDLFKLMTTVPGTSFHKEQLHAIFWADEEPSQAAGKLHTAVSRLRNSLSEAGFGDDAILFEDGYYHFNEAIVVHSDLAQFESHREAGSRYEAIGETELAISEYESAIALYRGEYLQGLVWEDWLLPRRVHIEQEFIELLSRISNCYYVCEHFMQAADYCYRVLGYDNLREDIYRRLMRCLHHQGQRNQAIKVYKELQNVLKQELGVEPMQQTKELIELIKEERLV